VKNRNIHQMYKS